MGMADGPRQQVKRVDWVDIIDLDKRENDARGDVVLLDYLEESRAHLVPRRGGQNGLNTGNSWFI